MTARFFEGRGIDVEDALGDFDEASSGVEAATVWPAWNVDIDVDVDEETDDDDERERLKPCEETTEFEEVLDICEVEESDTPMIVIAVAFP